LDVLLQIYDERDPFRVDRVKNGRFLQMRRRPRRAETSGGRGDPNVAVEDDFNKHGREGWEFVATLHGALARGYDATLVSDAHTTEDQTPWGAPPPDQVIAHTNLYWTDQTAPGRTAGTVETKNVDFGGTS
jgi:hypothetical protein